MARKARLFSQFANPDAGHAQHVDKKVEMKRNIRKAEAFLGVEKHCRYRCCHPERTTR